ncbi:MAG: BlaI/MecI/CopY family transcriptional regulator [Bryobacterales bacterium]|nr:BlaI/MecI/CopY family transcriptional regulator [Bryobacterales bacterium]
MARKKQSDQLTPLELEIMKVLWDAGSATVQTVQERLPIEPRLAYTTVQTMLNLLKKKGKVHRVHKPGERAFLYAPAVSRHSAVGQLVGDLVDRLFGGSAEGLVMSMVEQRYLKPEDLDKLNRMVAESKQSGGGRHGNR